MKSYDILEELRSRGIKIRRTPSGELQVYPSSSLDEAEKDEIRAHKAEILEALDEEIRKAVARGEEAAMEIISKSRHGVPRALVTEEIDGIKVITCRRRDGSGWSIQLPSEEWDPWRLASTLVSGAPEKLAK